jgi:hypothetical protein
VIRLWNRVGPFRVLAVLLLVGAVAGGAAVALNDSDDRPASASNNTDAADAEQRKQLAEMAAQHADAERAARSDAQRKADEAAVAAAEQAKKVPSPSPSKSASPKPSGSPGKPVNVPADCNGYSGNKQLGCALLSEFGFGLDQMPCLEKLWDKESGWRTTAENKSSGAYGIPQALPPTKLSKYGGDWRTNPATQIRWGLDYIRGRYKTPCGAWAYFQSHNHY